VLKSRPFRCVNGFTVRWGIWGGAPTGKIHRYDVSVAKNYLSAFELAQMQAMRRMPMTMVVWGARLGGFLKLWDRDILQDAAKVSAELAKQHAESEFEKYRIVQDRLFQSDLDRLLKKIEPPRKQETQA